MIICPPILCVLVLPVVVGIIGYGKLVAGGGLNGYAPAVIRSQSAERDERDSVSVGGEPSNNGNNGNGFLDTGEV